MQEVATQVPPNLRSIWLIFLYFIFEFFLLNVLPLSYLALISGIISEADYVFIPESPPPSDWARKLCDKLMQARPIHIAISHWKPSHVCQNSRGPPGVPVFKSIRPHTFHNFTFYCEPLRDSLTLMFPVSILAAAIISWNCHPTYYLSIVGVDFLYWTILNISCAAQCFVILNPPHQSVGRLGTTRPHFRRNLILLLSSNLFPFSWIDTVEIGKI